MDFIFDPSLVLYLPLYELDGASFKSKDAYGHLCTVTGAIWTPRGSRFDGSDDYIDTALTTDLSSGGDFSVFCWAKGDVSEPVYACCQSHSTDPYTSDWIIYIGGGAHTLLWMRSVSMSSPSWCVATDWNFIGLAWDKNQEKYEGFLNGVSLGLSDVVSGYGGVNSVKIGTRGDGTTSWFSGLIGEVIIYRRRLTFPEALQIYLATKWRYR